MEFYLCRAMEVARLLPDQVERLHAHELSNRQMIEYDPTTETCKEFALRKIRCLMPYEIQDAFHLPPLREHYRIPGKDSDQAGHNQRLRLEFRKLDLVPKGGELSALDPFDVHAFDVKVRSAVMLGKINFAFQGGGRGRTRDEFDDD